MNFTTAAIINWHGKAARAVYIVDKVGVRGQLMAKELESTGASLAEHIRPVPTEWG